MFQEVLREVVERVDGAMGALLMGYDGIAVDQYLPDDEGGMVETLGLEFSVILKDVRRAVEMLEAGSADELVLTTEHVVAIVRMLNSEYFVVVALKPNAIAGKARHYLRMSAPRIVDALG